MSEQKRKRKRISVTLTPEMEDFLDKMIEQKQFYNYQHAIEFCIVALAKKRLLIVDEILVKFDMLIDLVKEFVENFGKIGDIGIA